MLTEWLPLLILGFGLGLLHALDADHVMAVSTLANQNPSIKRTLLFSLHWALGHGGLLLASGFLLFGLGLAIPENLQYWAELMVGVLLIALGLSFFLHFRKRNVSLVEHKHDDIVHTHLVDENHIHTSEHTQKTTANNNEEIIKVHQPIMIGVLHGLAGSAPALALIPAVTSGQLSVAITYLMVFSIGVILSMLVFGLGFSWVQQYLNKYYQRVFIVCRHAIALTAIIVGTLLLVKTV